MKNREKLLKSYNKQLEIFNKSRDQRVKRMEQHISQIEDKLERLQKELKKCKDSLNDNLQTSFYSFEEYCQRADFQSSHPGEEIPKFSSTEKMNVLNSNDDDDDIIENHN